MSRKADEGRKDLKEIEDARAAARRRVKTIYPDYVLEGNVVCHLDQHPLNNDLRNLAIMSKSNHMKLVSILRCNKIAKGKVSKKFALALRSMDVIQMIHPLKKLSLYRFKLS